MEWRDTIKRKGWTHTWKVGKYRKDALINRKKGGKERTWGHLKHSVFCYLSLSQCPLLLPGDFSFHFLCPHLLENVGEDRVVERWAHVACFPFLFFCEPPTALCRTLLMCVVGVTPPNKRRTWDAKLGVATLVGTVRRRCWRDAEWGLWGEGVDEMDVLLGRRILLCAAVSSGMLKPRGDSGHENLESV